MDKIYGINPGIVSEWLSLIDPRTANDRDFDNKVAAILRSQVDMLLNSTMTEIRAKHWVLTKRIDRTIAYIDFQLIAYSSTCRATTNYEKEFSDKKVRLLRERLDEALKAEDYLRAAETRDLLRNLENDPEKDCGEL